MDKLEFYSTLQPQTHMLILGSSGSGKSVVLNGIMSSLLYTDCKLVCIDLKRVELSPYRKSKKCIRYAETLEEAVSALEWILSETDRRYKVMQRQGVRKSIETPIYVCIDEVAELLTVDKKRCMPLLQRIGQVSRAANIKMICCSQCLLSTVISTPLRINFDSVIGLRTETKRQSTMIIGQSILETLPKYGSLVHKDSSMMHPQQYNGVPMLDDNEIRLIIRDSNKRKPSYLKNKANNNNTPSGTSYREPKAKKSLIDILFPYMFCDGEA